MLKKLKLWFGRWIAKIFRRESPETVESVTEKILKNLLRLSQEGRVNIYNGTLQSLRRAQADHSSTIYIIEITYPPSREDLLTFNKYIDKLRSLIGKRGK